MIIPNSNQSVTPTGTGSLHYPFKKQQAAKIDNENYKFAKRIIG